MIPSVGIHRTDDHRYYWQGDGPFPSVTTAIKMYDKSAVLTAWAKRETAAFAVRNLDTLVAHRAHRAVEATCAPCVKSGRPYDPLAGAAKWVASIPDYQSDAAKDLGTAVHAIAEAMGEGEEPDVAPDLLPFAVQYQRFLDEYRPELLAVEYKGVNREHGYAGTGDFIARIGGAVSVIDIKSHTKPTPIPDTYYPETAMQLAACARFDFIGREGDATEYPLPAASSYGVLLLGRDDYRLIPYFVTDQTFEAFLACLALYRWQQGEARTVVGTPIKEAAA